MDRDISGFTMNKGKLCGFRGRVQSSHISKCVSLKVWYCPMSAGSHQISRYGFTSPLIPVEIDDNWKDPSGDRFETSNESVCVRDSRGGNDKLKWHPIQHPPQLNAASHSHVMVVTGISGVLSSGDFLSDF
jgi:hypothetical protein